MCHMHCPEVDRAVHFSQEHGPGPFRPCTSTPRPPHQRAGLLVQGRAGDGGAPGGAPGDWRARTESTPESTRIQWGHGCAGVVAFAG